MHNNNVSSNKSKYRVVLTRKLWISPSSGESFLVVRHVFLVVRHVFLVVRHVCK